MIKIDENQIPIPSSYQVGIMDLSEGGRVASGLLMIDRIATKRKLELSWRKLSNDDLSMILNLVAPVFFNVEYIDPQDNSLRTGEFYCGDRTIGTLDYVNGQIRWRDIKFNLIER